MDARTFNIDFTGVDLVMIENRYSDALNYRHIDILPVGYEGRIYGSTYEYSRSVEIGTDHITFSVSNHPNYPKAHTVPTRMWYIKTNPKTWS